MLFLCRRELHGLCPGIRGAGELATIAAGQIYLPDELARAPVAAQEPILEDIGPTYDHEVAHARTIPVDNLFNAFEIVRTVFFDPAEGQLFRLVTTLTATPIEDGVPGTPIDIGTFTDPFSNNPLPHPEGAEFALGIKWYFIWDTDRQVYASAPLATTQEINLSRGVGIPGVFESWSDYRYQWQSRYSDDHKSKHLPEGFGRLFVILNSITRGNWLVRAGGLVCIRASRKRPRRDMPGVVVK